MTIFECLLNINFATLKGANIPGGLDKILFIIVNQNIFIHISYKYYLVQTGLGWYHYGYQKLFVKEYHCFHKLINKWIYK